MSGFFFFFKVLVERNEENEHLSSTHASGLIHHSNCCPACFPGPLGVTCGLESPAGSTSGRWLLASLPQDIPRDIHWGSSEAPGNCK